MPDAAQIAISLAALNAQGRAAFTESLDGILEHSPHFAARAWDRRPFASVADLHAALMAAIAAAPVEEQLALIRSHPDLGMRLANLTPESTGEQRAAGLSAMEDDEAEELRRQNSAYRERFGFPFIICARLNAKDAIMRAMSERLSNDPALEQRTALAEIGKIAQLRLADRIGN